MKFFDRLPDWTERTSFVDFIEKLYGSSNWTWGHDIHCRSNGNGRITRTTKTFHVDVDVNVDIDNRSIVDFEYCYTLSSVSDHIIVLYNIVHLTTHHALATLRALFTVMNTLYSRFCWFMRRAKILTTDVRMHSI